MYIIQNRCYEYLLDAASVHFASTDLSASGLLPLVITSFTSDGYTASYTQIGATTTLINHTLQLASPDQCAFTGAAPWFGDPQYQFILSGFTIVVGSFFMITLILKAFR
jgi:hypothetical protein